jgi:hypothetical protein
MNLHKPTRSHPRLPDRHAALAWLGAACFLLGAGGCSTTSKGPNDDPLFGVRPAQVSPVPGASSGNNPSAGAQSRAGVPPIPGTTSATSTAALASLPGGRPLSINDPHPAAGSGGSANVSTGPSVQPIPREAATAPGLLTTGSWTTPPITPKSPPSASPDHRTDPNFALLQARGATHQKVDNVPEGVRLTALVASRADPSAARIYEASARDYGAAAQAVLQHIEQPR